MASLAAKSVSPPAVQAAKSVTQPAVPSVCSSCSVQLAPLVFSWGGWVSVMGHSHCPSTYPPSLWAMERSAHLCPIPGQTEGRNVQASRQELLQELGRTSAGKSAGIQQSILVHYLIVKKFGVLLETFVKN